MSAPGRNTTVAAMLRGLNRSKRAASKVLNTSANIDKGPTRSDTTSFFGILI